MTKYLGLDLGGTNIKVALIEKSDDTWTILEEHTTATEAEKGPSHVVARLADLAQSFCSDPVNDIAGVGLAVPGIFDAEKGTILLFPNLPGPWENFEIVGPIRSACGKPTGIINDARAFALSESSLGAAQGMETVACLILGTGVGGGIVINGKIHNGASGGAGEIAHQIVKADGPLCGCGARGCAESLTSSAALSKLAGTTTPEEAYRRALEGDEQALEAFKEVGKWLGIALANVMAVVSPDVFVIGGGVAQSGPLILDYIKEEMMCRCHLWPNSTINIVPAALGTYAGAIGAALYGAITEGAQLSRMSIT